MGTSSCYCCDTAAGPQSIDWNRCCPLCRCPIAELAVAIKTPGKNRTIEFPGEAVGTAGSNTYSARQESDVADVMDLNRRQLVGRSAVAKLTIDIHTPCPDAAIGFQGEGVSARE